MPARGRHSIGVGLAALFCTLPGAWAQSDVPATHTLAPPQVPSIEVPKLDPPSAHAPRLPALPDAPTAAPHAAGPLRETCAMMGCDTAAGPCDGTRRAHDRVAHQTYRALRGTAEALERGTYSLHAAIQRCLSLPECTSIAHAWSMGDDDGWVPARAHALREETHGRLLVKVCKPPAGTQTKPPKERLRGFLNELIR